VNPDSHVSTAKGLAVAPPQCIMNAPLSFIIQFGSRSVGFGLLGRLGGGLSFHFRINEVNPRMRSVLSWKREVGWRFNTIIHISDLQNSARGQSFPDRGRGVVSTFHKISILSSTVDQLLEDMVQHSHRSRVLAMGSYGFVGFQCWRLTTDRQE
jgi:hypothetical protein